MASFYSESELYNIGFKSIGNNCLISRKASIYGAENIEIGNNVRIDDFCILSGTIKMGDNIHISAGVYFFAGNAGIIIKNYASVSSRSVIYALNDDYSGLGMTNPTLPIEYRNVNEQEVVLEKHVLVGTGCTVLPGVSIGEGTSVGSMSLVNRSLDAWGIYAGIPCKRIKERNRNILVLEKMYLENIESGDTKL